MVTCRPFERSMSVPADVLSVWSCHTLAGYNPTLLSRSSKGSQKVGDQDYHPCRQEAENVGSVHPSHGQHVPCVGDCTADLHGLSEGRGVGDPAGSDISRALLLPPLCDSSLHTNHLPWTPDCPNQPKLQKWLCCWFISEGKVQAGAHVIGGWSFCSVCSTEWETFQFSGTL